jgi:hypothetical protein
VGARRSTSPTSGKAEVRSLVSIGQRKDVSPAFLTSVDTSPKYRPEGAQGICGKRSNVLFKDLATVAA